MKTSQAGLAHIAQEEGEVLHTYIDTAGKPTIGVGHLLRPGESYPNGITREQSRALLAQDVTIAESHVNANVKVPMTQNMFDALCSFTFNCGGGALKTSSMVKFLNEGKIQEAADAFMLWVKHTDPKTGKLVTSQGLVNRRKRERALFLKDVALPPAEPEPEPELNEPHEEEKDELVDPAPDPVAPHIEPSPPTPEPVPPTPITPERKSIFDFIIMILSFFFNVRK